MGYSVKKVGIYNYNTVEITYVLK